MECSVTEDSSLGAGGVGSGFSFSTVLVSFSWACSCAAIAKGVKLSSRMAASAVRRVAFNIVCVHSGADLVWRAGEFTRRAKGKSKLGGQRAGQRIRLAP